MGGDRGRSTDNDDDEDDDDGGGETEVNGCGCRKMVKISAAAESCQYILYVFRRPHQRQYHTIINIIIVLINCPLRNKNSLNEDEHSVIRRTRVCLYIYLWYYYVVCCGEITNSLLIGRLIK